MSSSLIDDLPIGGSAAPAGDGEAEGEFFGDPEIRPRGWIKRLLPRTMFGRSLLIIVMPLMLLQVIATWVFYDRHWTAISWRLSTGVAGDIGLMIEAIKLTGSDAAADPAAEAWRAGDRARIHPRSRRAPAAAAAARTAP